MSLDVKSNSSHSSMWSRPTRFGQRARSLFTAWTRYPSEVASIFPSSRFLTKQLADRNCIREAKRVVELGPGAGGTTEALLSQLSCDAQLLAIEKTTDFAEMLGLIDDARLRVEFGDAVDLIEITERNGFQNADAVVSGIPFSHLPPPTARRILAGIWTILRPGGALLAYQMRSTVQEYAHCYFGRAKTELVLMNIPPVCIFEWRKPMPMEAI